MTMNKKSLLFRARLWVAAAASIGLLPSLAQSQESISCDVDYPISDWNGAYQADVGITNTGNAPIAGWTLEWDVGSGESHSGGWNANIVQSGTRIRASNAASHWNGTIAPGATHNFGIQLTDAVPPAQIPAVFTLNGTVCNGGGSSSSSSGGGSSSSSSSSSSSGGSGSSGSGGSSGGGNAITLQENATGFCGVDGSIDSNNAGFTGGGFANTHNLSGTRIRWSLNAASASDYLLDWRFANGGSANRPANVRVNGADLASVDFPSTGGWTSWSQASVVVALTAGENTIELVASGSDGLANIDALTATGDGPSAGACTSTGGGNYQMENLTRGVTVVPTGNGNLVSWRILGTDDPDVAFNLYRNGQKINSQLITGASNYLDRNGSAGAAYSVRAVTNGSEGAPAPAELVFNGNGFFDVPIQRPAGGSGYTYSANDASAADLTGDGQYELIVKWDPSNSRDNSQSGFTGNVYMDAYRLNGERLWRINLGSNIRAGAHYTQFQAYDYDGDGRAEVAMKTADGTVDGTGNVIGNVSADYRNSAGYILSGPEFLTIFDGRTGAAIDTVDYQPPRGNVSSWGDNYGNRVDRFLAGTAWLDGATPSLIFSRGYYTRTVIWAVDFDGQNLSTRWIFDSNQAGREYEGQGAHSLSIADLNGDGRQDIVFGAMAIGANGQPLWNTRMYHGDALHVSDFVPGRPGQEIFMPAEHSNQPSSRLIDGRNGSVIFQTPANGDNGRAVAGNIWAGNPGGEFWSSRVSGLLNASGSAVAAKPGPTNFLIWWDGDGERELLDGTRIDNYDPAVRLLTGSNVVSNNGTKATPSLSADLFGDWREEVVWATSDSSALRIYATPYGTDLRIPTLMHDPQYRAAIAWQNSGYNQPPHPSFYIGSEVLTYPWPDIYTP
ncbi:cellulose binding domain-containing protein [Microbulbifer sp. MCCC 1A16149]|uniref:rhamnogalacturonan lyase family protein n=1 Tax=Microbulbifer sp. MCCC 1A16149 TaxID=3411322 RepID=UPI003D14E564